MAEKNEVAVSFSEQLTDKLISVENALPKDFNRERFVQNALSVINEKPELTKVNKGQLLLGLVKGAMLDLDYSNKEFYLIPYGSSVQFQIDYRGLMSVAWKYSTRKIKDIDAWIVREGDLFKYVKDGDNQYTKFEPIPFSNKDIVGCFCEIKYEDGGVHVEIMSTEEANEIRNNYSKSASSNSSPWKKSFSQMLLKSCIRRSLKRQTIDFASKEAMDVWEDDSDMNFIKKERNADVVDAFTVNTPTDIEVESTVVESEEQVNAD